MELDLDKNFIPLFDYFQPIRQYSLNMSRFFSFIKNFYLVNILFSLQRNNHLTKCFGPHVHILTLIFPFLQRNQQPSRAMDGSRTPIKISYTVNGEYSNLQTNLKE